MEEPPLQRMASQIDQPAADAADFLDGLSDEDLALFADSLAVQRELEAEDAAAAGQVAPPEDHAEDEERLVRALQAEAPAVVVESAARPDAEETSRVIPLPTRPSSARAWFPLAAAAVLLLAVAPFAWQALRGRGLAQPTEYVALLSDPNAALPAEIDKRPWGTRGSDPTMEQLRGAAQVGAYVVDLQLAIRAGDAGRVSLFAKRAERVLNGIDNAGPVVATQFQALGEKAGGDREELLADLAAATKAAQEVVDRDRFALGGWAEAARIAALQKDTAFFRSEGMGDALDRAERTLDGDEARAALQAIRAAAEAEPLNRDQLLAAIDGFFLVIA